MRSALLLAVLLAAFILSGRDAQARDYPWCAWYDWTTYNCGFDTLQQCLATVHGIGGTCRPNARYRPPPRRYREPHRERR